MADKTDEVKAMQIDAVEYAMSIGYTSNGQLMERVAGISNSPTAKRYKEAVLKRWEKRKKKISEQEIDDNRNTEIIYLELLYRELGTMYKSDGKDADKINAIKAMAFVRNKIIELKGIKPPELHEHNHNITTEFIKLAEEGDSELPQGLKELLTIPKDQQ